VWRSWFSGNGQVFVSQYGSEQSPGVTLFELLTACDLGMNQDPCTQHQDSAFEFA